MADRHTAGSNRPSSLELVKAYEEQQDMLWVDSLVFGASLTLLLINVHTAQYGGVLICLVLLAILTLMFEESAQNAYEYQHREGW